MALEITIFNPETLAPPLGQYSHVSRVKANEWLFLAGMLAVDRQGHIVGASDFEAQCDQVFANIAAALHASGANFTNVVQFTTYLVDSRLIASFMAFRQRAFPTFFPTGTYPPNTLLIVDRLVQEPFLIEVHTIAVL